MYLNHYMGLANEFSLKPSKAQLCLRMGVGQFFRHDSVTSREATLPVSLARIPRASSNLTCKLKKRHPTWMISFLQLGLLTSILILSYNPNVRCLQLRRRKQGPRLYFKRIRRRQFLSNNDRPSVCLFFDHQNLVEFPPTNEQ